MSAFIVLEGIEGSGKSTVAAHLAEHLKSKGRETVLTREPGATDIGKKLREIILSPENKELDSLTELLLFAADRAQHINELIKPSLEAGKCVISDRFMYSSIAYQGYGRGLDLGTLKQLNEIVVSTLRPDMVLLLDIDPEQAFQRVHARADQTPGGQLDRIELQKLEFHKRVHQGFHEIAKTEDRFVKIDSSQPLEDVVRQVKEEYDKRF